ncbi:SICAvar, type I (fragment), partial [Plasmodium knowlesi strain H]
MTTPSAGLLQTWLDEQVKGVIQGGATVTDPAERAKQFTEKMKADLVATWDVLAKWLERPESNEIHKLCDKGQWGGNSGEGQYKKILCQAILEIKYFMNGVQRQKAGGGSSGHDEPAEMTALTPDEAFNRCIVGTVALSTIYGDHCKLNEVINEVQGEISSQVDIKLRDHLSKNKAGGSLEQQLNKCSTMTYGDLVVGKSVLGNTIRAWTEGKRALRMKAQGWRIKMPWHHWPNVCNQKKEPAQDDMKLKQYLRDNAQSMTTFLKLDNTNTGQNRGLPLAELLINSEIKLPDSTVQGVLEEIVANSTNGQVDPDKLKEGMQKVEKETQNQIGKYYIME